MITFEELLKRAKSEIIAIHTPTEEQAIALLTELEKRGYEWRDGDKLTDIKRYKNYKEDTCYSFHDYSGNLLNKKIMFSSLIFYQKCGYTIIEFSEIDFKEEQHG